MNHAVTADRALRRHLRASSRCATVATIATVAMVAALLCSVVHTPPAYAEQNPAKANALFKKAKAKLDAGHADAALRLVSKATTYFAHPAIFLLKAKTLHTLGRYERARAVLEAISTRKLPSAFKKARARGLKAAKAALAKSGHLLLEVQPAQAEVTIDGRRIEGKVDTWLLAGTHDVTMAAPGYRSQHKKVHLAIGDKAVLTVALRKLVGALRLRVVGGLKGVDLKVDGETVTVAEGKRAGDVVTLTLSTGEHEVACSRGSLLESHPVTIALDKTRSVVCSQIGGGPSRVVVASLGWGGVAAGVALAGYGAWGLQSYFSDVSRADQQGLVMDTNKHYGGALYLASGLAIGVTSYLLFAREPPSAAPATALARPSPWQVAAD